ncbi:MAG: acyl-CoA dehydrogenase family protein [Candidatus Marinimicrobia bacterium]|nr:acyl-CoA dehydrogenase family protein [Candidatus Neomarinimicrobiota bacterium]
MEQRYFTEEHRLLQGMVREFARSEVEPVASEMDRQGQFPTDLVAKLAKLGLMGVPIPSEFGGAGMDTVAYTIAVHELGVVDASLAITVAAHTSLGTMPILMFGSEQLKKKYLAPLAQGELIGAFGLTEPQAGSDAGATRTRAERRKDRYIVNGQKIFCTNAGIAGVIIFTARLIEDGEDLGICNFLVETGTSGLRTGPPEKKMGWRASDTRSLYFEDVEIPLENLVGEASRGFSQFLEVLAGGRISVGALALGTAEGAYRRALSYSLEREAFGQTISKFQAVQFKLADMATQFEAAKHLVYHAAWLKDQGYNIVKESAMAKLFASEIAMDITSEAIQIHGGYGYIREYQVERFFRDAKALAIGEGTSEIQRMLIAREILREAELS